MLLPKEYDAKKKYPGILAIHGGPKTVYGSVFYHEMQFFAAEGYVALFSLIGISIIGAMTHNIGQLCIATIIVQNLRLMLLYLPFLLLIAVPIGLLTGIIARRLLPYLNRILPQKSHDKSLR